MTNYFVWMMHGLIILTVKCTENESRDPRNLQFFQVLLRNPKGAELTLNYQLQGHSVSIKFARLIRKILLSSKYKISHTAWAVYPSGDSASRILYDSLQSNMKYFEENNGVGLKFSHHLSPFDSISTKDLNLIHSDFEKLITQTFQVPTGQHNLRQQPLIAFNTTEDNMQRLESSLNAVNGRIHALEHILSRDPTSSHSFFTTYLSSYPHVKDIQLSKEEYSMFRLDNSWGGLYLGYGTTGKSLYHIYKDKDLALLEGGGRPSPQQVVTSNILSAFYDTESHDTMYKAMMTWLVASKIGVRLKVDLTSPENAIGYIKLGQLVLPPEWRNLTRNEIIAIISPYDEILRYLII